MTPDQLVHQLQHALPAKATSEVSTAEDVARASDALYATANFVLQTWYGGRVRFTIDPLADSSTRCWIAQSGFSERTIAVLRCVPRGSIKPIKFENGVIVHDKEDGDRQSITAKAMKLASGCNFVALFDYDSLLLFKYTGPNDSGNKEPVRMRTGPPEGYRSFFVSWLGEAVLEAGVKMIKAVPRYSIEESDIFKLGFGKEAEFTQTLTEIEVEQDSVKDADDASEFNQFLQQDADGNSTSSYNDLPAMLALAGTKPSAAMYMYDKDGRVIDIGQCTLPKLPASTISTPSGVAEASKKWLIDVMAHPLQRSFSDQVKLSMDIVPDAAVCYLESPSDLLSRKMLGIQVHRPCGTIEPSDWGVLMPNLTFSNGKGVIGSAGLLIKEMRKISQKYSCPCVSLFDYQNLALLTFEPGMPTKMWMSEQDQFRGTLWIMLKKACRLGGVKEQLGKGSGTDAENSRK